MIAAPTELESVQARSFVRCWHRRGLTHAGDVYIDDASAFAREWHGEGFRSGGQFAMKATANLANIPAQLGQISNALNEIAARVAELRALIDTDPE